MNTARDPHLADALLRDALARLRAADAALEAVEGTHALAEHLYRTQLRRAVRDVERCEHDVATKAARAVAARWGV